eukprot:scaffold62347_cov28-Tisochrysis_lutea.AAC.1
MPIDPDRGRPVICYCRSNRSLMILALRPSIWTSPHTKRQNKWIKHPHYALFAIRIRKILTN